jgi:uncharacterized membrane protein
MLDQEKNSLGGLRSAALIAVALGGVGSIGLLRHAQQHPPPIVIAGFVLWVLAPFAILGGANLLSSRWPVSLRKTLAIVTLFVAVASLGIYFDDNLAHRTAKPAFVYVATPPVTVLLSVLVMGVAFLARKKEAKSGDGDSKER